MIVRSWMVPVGNQEANIHLIACERTREAALVDAGGYTEEMREFIRAGNLQLRQVLITHAHYDHVDALEDIIAEHAPRVLASTQVSPGAVLLSEGDTVQVGDLTGRVVKTSGHTPDSISFIFGEEIVFSGDALFAGSIGGTSSEDLKREEITHVRKKILSLAGSCEIRSGHGPATTVEIERAANPFFV
jgi:glyoxylase-like metal-dependent hydrolase (beta-lactamase superfamily II)